MYKHTQNNEYLLKGLFMLEQWQEDNDIKTYREQLQYFWRYSQCQPV